MADGLLEDVLGIIYPFVCRNWIRSQLGSKYWLLAYWSIGVDTRGNSLYKITALALVELGYKLTSKPDPFTDLSKRPGIGAVIGFITIDQTVMTYVF